MMTAKQIIDAGLFDVAVALMDTEIMEEVHADLAPCTQEQFLEEYMKRHEERYGIGFEVN